MSEQGINNPVDWSKPIQFVNGEPCELSGTYEYGYPLFPDCTRCVKRIGVEPIEAAYWFFPESGQCKDGSLSKKGGYDIINR